MVLFLLENMDMSTLALGLEFSGLNDFGEKRMGIVSSGVRNNYKGYAGKFVSFPAYLLKHMHARFLFRVWLLKYR